MPRLNVYIPEELWKKLEEVKDEIQPSSLFQDALKQELQRIASSKEILLIDGEDVWDVVAERLRKEKTKLMGDSFNMGVKDGLSWAKTATYVKLLEYASKEENESKEELPEEVFRRVDGFEFEDINPFEIMPNEYIKGWWKGLNDAWSLLEEKIERSNIEENKGSK